MTMLFRAAQKSDLNAIHDLAMDSGAIGITTLPKDINLLKKRLAWSNTSFAKQVSSPCNEYYLFVLENTADSKIIGTSAIEAAIGFESPFYSYRVSTRTRICLDLNIRNNYKILSVVNDNQGNSEICTLFLHKDYRNKHNGLLLSRARFLFIAQYPCRFASTIIAELRGISDEKGHSPFWDNLGRHFFQMSFEEADRLTVATNKQFIADLMPRNLIYVPLLSPEAQAVIGQPHESTLPAMNILLREGFHYNNYVDIFDAGPLIEASRDQIRTVSTSKTLILKNITDDVSSKPFIVSNNHINFRAIVAQVFANDDHTTCMLDQTTAELLQVKCGDVIRISPLQIDQGNS